MSSENAFQTFEAGQATAAAFIAVAAAFSTFAISFALVRIGLVAVWPILQGQGWKGQRSSRESVFFHTQVGLYAACLLVANLFSSSAALIEISWSSQGGITIGGQCTSQGMIIQIGDFAGAYFTTAIAAHTFSSLVLRIKCPSWITGTVIFVGWFSAILIGTAVSSIGTAAKGPFFAPVGLWCWISDRYPLQQFMLHYFWIFLAEIATAVLYVLIFLHRRGTLVINKGISLKLGSVETHCTAGCLDGNEDYCHFLRHIARAMLLYPISYVILLFPIIISRLTVISGRNVSFQAFAFSAVCSSLLGLVNVIVIYVMLRVLAPAYRSPPTPRRSPDVESFFTPEQATPSPKKQEKAEPVRPVRSFPPPVSRAVSIASEPFHFPHARQGVQELDFAEIDLGLRPVKSYNQLAPRVQSVASESEEPYRFPPVAGAPARHHGLSDRPRGSPRTQPSAFGHRRYDTNGSASSTARLIRNDASGASLGLHGHTMSGDSAVSAASTSTLGRRIVPADVFEAAVALSRPEPALHRDVRPGMAQPFRPAHRRTDHSISSTASAESFGIPVAPTRPPRSRMRSPLSRMPSIVSVAEAAAMPFQLQPAPRRTPPHSRKSSAASNTPPRPTVAPESISLQPMRRRSPSPHARAPSLKSLPRVQSIVSEDWFSPEPTPQRTHSPIQRVRSIETISRVQSTASEDWFSPQQARRRSRSLASRAPAVDTPPSGDSAASEEWSSPEPTRRRSRSLISRAPAIETPPYVDSATSEDWFSPQPVRHRSRSLSGTPAIESPPSEQSSATEEWDSPQPARRRSRSLISRKPSIESLSAEPPIPSAVSFHLQPAPHRSRSPPTGSVSVDSLPIVPPPNVFAEISLHTPTTARPAHLSRNDSLISMYFERPSASQSRDFLQPGMPRPPSPISEHQQEEEYVNRRADKSDSLISMYMQDHSDSTHDSRIVLSAVPASPPPAFAPLFNASIEEMLGYGAESRDSLGAVQSAADARTRAPAPDAPSSPQPALPSAAISEGPLSLIVEDATHNSPAGSLRAELHLRKPTLPDMPGLSSPDWAALVTKAAFGDDFAESLLPPPRPGGHAKSHSESAIDLRGLVAVPRNTLRSGKPSPKRIDSFFDEDPRISFFRPASVVTVKTIREPRSRRNPRLTSKKPGYV